MVFTVTEIVTDTFESITPTSSLGEQWDLVYDIKAPQVEFVAFYFDYTQDASSKFNFQVSFEAQKSIEEEDLEDVFYKETFLDSTSSSQYNPEHSSAGKYRVIIPVTFTCSKIKITIVPDVATGSDTLVCHAESNSVKGNR